MGRKSRILPLVLAVTLLGGCSASNWSAPADCALIGVGVGVLGGMVYASAATDRNAEDYAIGIGVGLAGGALLGWAWCSLMDYTGSRAAAPARVKTVQSEPELPTPTAGEQLAEFGIDRPGSNVLLPPSAPAPSAAYTLAHSN